MDFNLRAEVFFTGLKFPTNMAFLGPDDILVLEKNNGTVRRIVNGQMLQHPLLDLDVANKWANGMLGITIAKNSTADANYVFFYYTESVEGRVDEDPEEDGVVLGNRLYRYELKDNKLVNPKLLLDLPAVPGLSNNGGVVATGPDNNIYLVVGDLTGPKTVVSNNKTGLPPDGTAGILRVTQDGKVVGNGILGDTYPLNLYYAYGIRNSFGMDFDPVSGNLWDTENGPAYGDEINFVKPGFNSGWMRVQGIWKPVDAVDKDKLTAGDIMSNPSRLLDFEGKGNYSSPEFAWKETSSPTALKFFNSDKFGADYKNDMFVADAYGKIYHFELNENRTRLVLGGLLSDSVADDKVELQDMIFATNFDTISDIEVGPDHNLYVISYPTGTIFKIVPLAVT
jgi:glucose/arabinose dehydrogenase